MSLFRRVYITWLYWSNSTTTKKRYAPNRNGNNIKHNPFLISRPKLRALTMCWIHSSTTKSPKTLYSTPNATHTDTDTHTVWYILLAWHCSAFFLLAIHFGCYSIMFSSRIQFALELIYSHDDCKKSIPNVLRHRRKLNQCRFFLYR